MEERGVRKGVIIELNGIHLFNGEYEGGFCMNKANGKKNKRKTP